MEENKNPQIDAFLKKQIQEIPLESPSKDFTQNLMGILTQEESKAIQYEPLISKRVWAGISALVTVFIAFLLFNPFQKQEGSLLEKVPIDFSFLDQISFSGLFDGLSVSNVTLYGLLLFSMMISIQVFYLKGYFSKRFSGL